MLCYALRAAIAWRAYPAAAHGIVKLYATAAAWLFAIVLITGVISALVLVPLGSLLTTSYGLFLVAKAAVVCVAAGLAMAGRMWLRRPAAGVGPALATKLEVAALAVVLAITGILTVLTPPATGTSAPSTPARGRSRLPTGSRSTRNGPTTGSTSASVVESLHPLGATLESLPIVGRHLPLDAQWDRWLRRTIARP